MNITDDTPIKVDILYGHIELRSWIEFDGEKYVGMGMKKTFDKDGNLKDCEVRPTGLVARYS